LALLAPLPIRRPRRPAGPGRLLAPSAEHWLGTDDSAAISWSRLLYGSRVTLGMSSSPWWCWPRRSGCWSAASPAIRRHRRRRADARHRRLPGLSAPDPGAGLRCRPGPGIENAVIAIALTAWPPYARLARAETLTIRNADFISAVQMMGASPLAHHPAPRDADVPPP
jgi:peptide/nickel transport system permease protein